jgi:eukaryotic-like serine/threonine-protein kinase
VSETPRDDPQALVGKLIAERYRVEKVLGAGGMGVVYRATHVQLRKTVALKTLHQELTRFPEVVARFEREAIAASRIEHVNVAAATDFGRLDDGTFYLVLEYVEGESLRECLHREKSLEPSAALNIARQIADALKSAHARDIVHRDLKPENIMLVSRPDSPVRIKVLDFGMAKVPLEGSPEGITAVGSILGTPAYMSPEQCAGGAIDARSDLYSLGIILYEVVNGRLPFVAGDALALLSHHLASAPAPMNSDVPPKIADIITRLLEKDPAQRVQSAQDLLGIFDAAARGSQDAAIAQGAGPLATDRQFLKIRRLFVLAAPLGTRLRRVMRAAVAWVMQWAKRRIRIRTFETSLGWGVAIALILAAGALLLAAPVWRSHASGPAVPGSSGAAAAKLDSVLPRGSRAEFQRQVERIEMLKSYERGEQDWILLARGYTELGQWQKSAQAYRAVLSLHPSLRSDPLLLSDLQLLAQDPEAFKVVVNLSETVLGQYGVDLLWLVWQPIRHDPEQADNADKLRKKLVVLSHRARPSLRVAIELDYYQTCPALESVVNRAAKAADRRSLAALQALQRTTGCGPRQEYDCTPCVRAEGILEKAIERAKSNSPPPLGAD